MSPVASVVMIVGTLVLAWAMAYLVRHHERRAVSEGKGGPTAFRDVIRSETAAADSRSS